MNIYFRPVQGANDYVGDLVSGKLNILVEL